MDYIFIALAFTMAGIWTLLAGKIIVEQRKLFHEIRLMAEKYPPYVPASADLDAEDQSRVEVAKDWDEGVAGRD